LAILVAADPSERVQLHRPMAEAAPVTAALGQNGVACEFDKSPCPFVTFRTRF
jgi:hypothetical protein